MQTWPLQRNCDDYYGNPRGSGGKASASWESKNLSHLVPPWAIYFDGQPIKSITVHYKAYNSLKRILEAIWLRLGKSQAEIDRVGLSKFSGSYNFRKMTSSNALSMHAYGCAVDFDSSNNNFGDTTPAMDRRVVEEFEREGWEWGGHWGTPDGMHFQAAWTRPNPARLGPLTASTRVTTKQLVEVSRKANLISRVRTWFTGLGISAGGVFTADNLGLFQGWYSVFSGLGKVALVIGAGALAYWVFAKYLLDMIKDDHDSGRWVPSSTVKPEPEPESADGVV